MELNFEAECKEGCTYNIVVGIEGHTVNRHQEAL